LIQNVGKPWLRTGPAGGRYSTMLWTTLRSSAPRRSRPNA